VAYLVCNFPGPVDGKLPTFNHDDVITLFHECGHGLHHLLTRVDELPVSGIAGVEWDAVELPSQFMENFCWEWDVLQDMTAHVETGEKLPRALYDKMIAAKNFQSGMQTVRQVEFSLFDMRLHHDYQPGGEKSVQELLAEVRSEVSVIIPPAWHRFPNSFSHIFAGGYCAGYYSYKWAEVLSADAFAAFEEAAAKNAGSGAGSVLDRATGKRFADEVLGVGGSRPALESFKAFRGRAPKVDALLRHSGMIAAAVCTLGWASAQADVFRWTDKEGKVHYSDNPPPDAKVERKSGGSKAEPNAATAQLAPVTLYVSSACQDLCDKARKLLNARKVPFSESVVESKDDIDAMIKLTGKKEPIAPTLLVGDKPLMGFEAGSWNSALDTAGYPKAP
jgi:glutaredoxin